MLGAVLDDGGHFEAACKDQTNQLFLSLLAVSVTIAHMILV